MDLIDRPVSCFRARIGVFPFRFFSAAVKRRAVRARCHRRFHWNWGLCCALFLVATVQAGKVRVGVPLQTISAGVFAAQDFGEFARQGVEVELVEFALGRDAIAQLFAGALDLAVAAETPLVHATLAGRDYTIVATVGQSTRALALVGRRDSGVNSFRDVRNKRVGITRGTNAEFFFESFRVLNGIPRDEVDMVEVPAEELVTSLTDKVVDAVMAWEPYLTDLKTRLKEDAFCFDGGGMYSWSWNLLTTQAVLAERSVDVLNILRALVETGSRLEQDRGAIVEVLERRKLPPPPREDFASYTFKPQLSQQLILQMEAQYRWLSPGGDRKLPNFLRYLDTGPLRRIVPEAVSVIE
jgi:NitT/TauT family transport system substrate-binding protein